MNWIVKNFLRGLVVVVPTALTIYLLYEAFVRIDSLLRLPIAGAGFVITIVLLVLVGALASNFFVRKFLQLTELLFTRAPLVRLIYASISGYGQTGPDAAKGGFDLVAQGVSGIMSITGEPGGRPVKAGIPLTDLGAGLFAVAGILAALQHRHRTGAGQHVDTSLVEAGVALSVWEATEFFAGLGVPEAKGSAHRMFAPYQAIRCADGYITLGTANDRLFRRLCDLLDHPEWVTDAQFADNTTRVRNHAALAARIEAITSQQPRRHWLELFDANNIPCGPINDYAQVFADPQVAAREMVVDVEHPVLGSMKALGSAVKLSATPVNPRRRAPLLGEHTDSILMESGFSAEEIAVLRGAGALG